MNRHATRSIRFMALYPLVAILGVLITLAVAKGCEQETGNVHAGSERWHARQIENNL